MSVHDELRAALERAIEAEQALRDIAYVGQNGSPVDEPDAVAKWCSQRAKEALGMVPAPAALQGR